MARWVRTLGQSLFSPVLSTSLYFIVFGSAIGSRMGSIDERQLRRVYRAGPHHALDPDRERLQRLVRHLHAALGGDDLRIVVGAGFADGSRVRLCRRGRDQIGRSSAWSFSSPRAYSWTVQVMHPVWMLVFLVLTSVSFCLFGFILGVLADGFEKLQIVPMLILTPLTFLGGTFYSLSMLPPLWQKVTLFNPIVYLISGFRWAFLRRQGDINIGLSLTAIAGFLTVCLTAVYWIFKTGYRLKT